MRVMIGVVLALGLGGCSGDRTGNAHPGGSGIERRSAMGQSFALTNQSMTLPTDETEKFPPGPNVQIVDAACRACHSPSVILTQPPLKHEEWAKTIDKMRTAFKATVDDGDVPKILVYLDGLSAQQAPRPGASAQPPANGGR